MITVSPLRQQPQLDEREQRDPPMAAIRRIVVPLDGSQVAERALAWAVALGRSFRAELLLVRAYGSGSGLPSGNARWATPHTTSRDALTPASLYLARITNELRNCGVRVATRLLPLHAEDAILEVAAHTPVDLILLSVVPHASGGRARSLGRVADRVVRQSRVPVLLTTSLKGGQMLCPERVPPRVLVPLDLAVAGVRALPYARAFAAAFHGRITLVLRSMVPVAASGEVPEHAAACLGAWETLPLTAETSEEFVAGMSGLAGNLIVWGRPETGTETQADDARWVRSAIHVLCTGHRPVLMVP